MGDSAEYVDNDFPLTFQLIITIDSLILKKYMMLNLFMNQWFNKCQHIY